MRYRYLVSFNDENATANATIPLTVAGSAAGLGAGGYLLNKYKNKPAVPKLTQTPNQINLLQKFNPVYQWKNNRRDFWLGAAGAGGILALDTFTDIPDRAFRYISNLL